MNIRIDSHVKPPRLGKMKRRADAKVREAYNAYSEAYYNVYGVRPTGFRTEGDFVYIGLSAGVTLARLREMTTQLKYRKG